MCVSIYVWEFTNIHADPKTWPKGISNGMKTGTTCSIETRLFGSTQCGGSESSCYSGDKDEEDDEGMMTTAMLLYKPQYIFWYVDKNMATLW